METKQRVSASGEEDDLSYNIFMLLTYCDQLVYVSLVHRHVSSSNLFSPIIGDSVVYERISHGNHVVDDEIHSLMVPKCFLSTSCNKMRL